MGKPLKVLIVEDRKEDEELLLRELKKADYDPLSERVENSQEMSLALDKQEWDMVFSDYVMPAFSGLEALKLLRGKGFAEIPFVIVSGSIGEELAVEALKSGVNDYIFKDNFLRLAKIVEQELEWAREKKKLRGFQEAIFARAKEWEEIFNAIKDSVMLLDADGRIVNCNKATQELLNKDKADILNKYCYEIVHKLSSWIKDCPIERMRETKHRESGILHIGANIFEVTVFPILDDKANLIKAVHVVSDITERKKAEDVLKRDKHTLEKLVNEGAAELIKTQKELADARRLSDISQLAATVAHELRNPLGVIKTAVYNLRKKATDSALSKHFDNIDTKISESDLIIQNLLDYSHIRIPQFEKVAVNDILNSCIRYLHVKYAKWNVKVEIELHSGGNIIIEGDSLHLSELFTNILDNSYQAFLDKKGRIEVDVDYKPVENRLDMKFKDNGIGIADKDIQKVFDPFYTNKPRGVGLGLTVCKQLVLFHGGTIDLSSKKGKGTTVFLSLPVRRA